MNKSNLIIFLSLFVVFVACSHDHSHEGNDHGHNHNMENGEDSPGTEGQEADMVHLLQQQMDVMNIELGRLRQMNLSTTVKANGQLQLPPQNQASVGAVMGGKITSISVVEGDFVSKGRILARIEHPEFVEIQEEFMRTRSELEFLEKEFERDRKLFEDSIVTEQDFQRSRAEFRSKLASFNGLRLKVEMLGINTYEVENGNFSPSVPVISPITGYIKRISVNMGMYVEPQTALFEIVDNDHLHIDLMVYEKDMNKVKNNQKVMFSLSNHPDSVFEGSIFAIGRSFEEEPRAMVVHAEIDNRNGNLLPGMYVDARIITDESNVSALPDDAIVSDGGLDYVFVLMPDLKNTDHSAVSGDHHHGPDGGHDDEYIFKKVEVNAGASDIGFTHIIPVEELSENAQFVTRGAYYLLAEMQKGEGSHGHHH